ncbi:energy-coupling factor transporter transmembrane protein EcfT [Labedella populi]|uniref:Energy-coupling factor transporter transmembrane protein EcfT n=1 Tax=Labedella populi TaxID=2498850 RepID=A0A444Q6P1_9MICO|nr:energy-coupling factor transporter transmembrane component T [Labedella populi]RWZ59574.1 energy-coupling factor transporter transmembrane protein EcfT [Labedella populi]
MRPGTERSRGYLHGLNPLVTVVAPLPAMIAVIVSRDLATPVAFLLLGLGLILTGAHPSTRTTALLVLVLPAAIAIGTVGFGVWTDPARVDRSVVLLDAGAYRLYEGSLLAGLAASLRLAALLVLALLAGLSATGPDFVRSTVQYLRLPYRIAYTALAAYRFVPRFRRDLELIRQAHRVRGPGVRRGPGSAISRVTASVVPLLAGAIRHAERVALAMDARAFGAHSTRTERHLVPLRGRDAVFVTLSWAVTAAIVVMLPAH